MGSTKVTKRHLITSIPLKTVRWGANHSFALCDVLIFGISYSGVGVGSSMLVHPSNSAVLFHQFGSCTSIDQLRCEQSFLFHHYHLFIVAVVVHGVVEVAALFGGCWIPTSKMDSLSILFVVFSLLSSLIALVPLYRFVCPT